ncbi:CRISPR-associated endonuclease Cas3'' [Azospirillum agricola]|uniref:CRISPR-associated endonuclease Cas3'' n=1 Tax=Azospirillum agricola TaxID=1720247 RepID=UPI000A0EED90|nr:CRISPR-associated endonuclease Cas3'' [Azospirillum agricola]SMH57373.1 CRISPR-associated helicase, Cas3 family [Azospirillum lipoferum]
MDWYAHTPKIPGAPWEPLREHLLRVAARAEGFASVLFPESRWAGAWARALGLLHDAGKYADAFQSLLKDGKGRVDHSTVGAVFALERYGDRSAAGWLLAYAVAGHHAGLPDGGGSGDGSLTVRLRKARIPDSVRADFLREVGPLLPAELPLPPFADPFAVALFARMIFSCLTDADALATEGYSDPETAALRGGQPDLPTLAAALRMHLAGKAAGADHSDVNRIRVEVLERCRDAAALPPGLFSLAVPTGGGKTLSSLSFALEHALRHGLRRVIYVIPYLSIIEQTAEVFRHAAFAGLPGAVLEHHSAYGPPGGFKDGDEEGVGPDRHKLASENWDSPVTVTTAVQFFESFFAARPSRCRKLRNVAGSVIVLDEAQLLPLPHLRPCLVLLEALARDYGCTVLLSTATQPALGRDQPLPFGLEGIRPIMPGDGAPALHRAMERVRVEHAGRLDDEALAGLLADDGNPQALCVLDTRGHAADLHRMLTERKVDGVRHLSAAMCAEHRSAVLAAIRADLDAKRPCRVVSTQLVEAGVDLDFPLVLRAMAGLDSIAQSAGRCNREGRLDGVGRVVVFDTERRNGLSDLNRRRDITKELMAARPWEEALRPDALSTYFHRLYGASLKKRTFDGGDPYDVARAWERLATTGRPDAFPFRAVAADFHLIDNEQVAVITPYTDEAKRWAVALRASERPGPLARKLQRFTVTIPRGQLARLMAAGIVEAIGEHGQFLLLTDCDGHYDAALGLTARDPRERTELENVV